MAIQKLSDIAKKNKITYNINHIGDPEEYLKNKTNNAIINAAKKTYNTYQEATNSLSGYSAAEINQALQKVKSTKSNLKNNINEMSKKNLLPINQKISQNRSDYFERLKNPMTKYDKANYTNNRSLTGTLEKLDSKYSEEKKQAENKIINSDDFKEYKNYQQNVVPLVEQVSKERKVANSETTTGNKIFAPVVGGLINALDSAVKPGGYKLKNGQVRLPSYEEMKAQKTIEDYDIGIGKLWGQASYSIGQQIPSMVAGAVTGGLASGVGAAAGVVNAAKTAGSLSTMFANVASNTSNQKIMEGYTKEQARDYALASGAIELGTEMMFGGMGKLMGTGALDEIVTEKLTKNIKNRVLKTLAEAGISSIGEGIEEVVSDALQPIAKKIALDDPRKMSEIAKDENALEDFIVGTVSSAIMSAPSSVVSFKNNTNQQTTNIDNTQTNLQNEKFSQNSNDTNNNVYQYTQSNNQKINNLRESASRYFNNSEQTQKFINTLEKIISDKNYNVVFDNTLTSNSGNIVNAQIKTLQNGETEIRLNPNSSRSGEFLIMHEVTHAIETDTMKKLVLNYASKHSNFNEALESLKSTYGTNDVSSEVLADISGQLFGNQEFINNLSMENPSIFKKIYNAIISLANKITGNSHESLFVQDLKNKWESAYRTQSNKLNNEQYSKGKLNTGEDVIISDDLNGSHPSKKQAQTSLEHMLGVKYNNESSNQILEIENKDIKKYLNDGYHNNKNMNLKKRISGNYGEILEISKIDPNKTKPNYKGTNRGKQGFDYYNVNLAYPIKDINGNTLNYRYYDARLVVRKENNGNFAYDLDNFKEKKGVVLDDIKPSIMADNSADDSFDINNISQSNTNVNSDTKYSIQENKNNTQELDNNSSFSLNKYEDLLEKYIYPKHVYERFKNEDKTKITKTIEELEKYKETLDTSTDDGWDNNFLANQQIDALESGFDNVYDYLVDREKTILKQEIDGKYGLGYKLLQDGIKQEQKNKQLQEDINNSSAFKNEQFKIIQETNPAPEESNYVWIRSPKDIKSFEEAINDEDSFTWGDYSKEDALRDLKRNKVRIYSSYAIKNGVFVSTSYEQALEYAGMDRAKVHSKEVNPNRVAWINGDEGQYASVTNISTNEDIRYSKNNDKWQNYVENNYKSTGTKTNMQGIKLPKYSDNEKVNNNSTINESKYSTAPLVKESRDATKLQQRKHYESIIESKTTTPEAKAIAEELMGTDMYVPESNKQQLETADYNIKQSGADNTLTKLSTMVDGDNRKITAIDIAEGERLIQYYSKLGDYAHLQEAIQTTAMLGTQVGRAVQAMSMIKRMTPDGQLLYIQRVVNKANRNLENTKRTERFDFTQEMQQTIVNSTNQEELSKNVNKVLKELGEQVPKSTLEQLNEWRYFSMLASPRTHIRNILGNTTMGTMQLMKNKVAGVIETIYSKFNKNAERTHSVKGATKEVKNFAKNDIKNVAEVLGLETNKYADSTVKIPQKTFKSDKMNKTVGRLMEMNSNLLTAEDGIGLKAGYVRAFSDYVTANNFDVNNMTTEQLNKTRNYAVEQAKLATFHQYNSIASAINTIENKNLATKLIVGGILPFKQTPMNIATTGWNYSPAGLATTLTKGVHDLRTGKINANQFIDNLSQGLTGTGIALLGYALTSGGILKASGNDDNEDYENAQGKQSYAITIGDNTYSLDWLAPVGIPLFIGSELYQIASDKTNKNGTMAENENKVFQSATNILDAMANAMNPMSEMSMISGLTSALQSYSQGDTQFLAKIGVNAIQSYATQFVPTALGQVAKTLDTKERSTSSTQQGVLPKAFDTAKNQIMSKIPGVRNLLPVATDVWGNEKKQSSNILGRAILNSLVPATVKKVTTNEVDKEIERLYDSTGEKSSIPDTYINKKLTIDGKYYRLSNEEYSYYKKNYGSLSYDLISKVINSSSYKNLTDEQKNKALASVYEFVNAFNKDDYANKYNISYTKSADYTNALQVIQNGGDISDFMLYKGTTTGLKDNDDKLSALKDLNLSNTSKSAIYSSTLGEKDKTYQALKYTNVNMDYYLDYKLQDFQSDKNADGETISGSKKAKVVNYIASSSMTYEQKLYLYGTQYSMTNSEKSAVVNYILSLNISTENRELMLEKLTGVKVKDGRVYW